MPLPLQVQHRGWAREGCASCSRMLSRIPHESLWYWEASTAHVEASPPSGYDRERLRGRNVLQQAKAQPVQVVIMENVLGRKIHQQEHSRFPFSYGIWRGLPQDTPTISPRQTRGQLLACRMICKSTTTLTRTSRQRPLCILHKRTLSEPLSTSTPAS